MSYLIQLQTEAVQRGLLEDGAVIDAATAFQLVRDMPYMRASNRAPETIIGEWRGTCSGKHYLLKHLLEELGFTVQLVACTVRLELDPSMFPPPIDAALQESNGRFVDVHNYLILKLDDGDMLVDATWPIGIKPLGMIVNETFVLGQSHQLAYVPIKTWIVGDDVDPQAFKERLLREHFTQEELIHRDKFILTTSQTLAAYLKAMKIE